MLAEQSSDTGQSQAIEYLKEAAQLAEEIGLPGALWLMEAVGRELYLKRGEVEQARRAA